MIVPYQSLQPETLAALIEEFITRDGAVHGHTDRSMPGMTAAVMKQLKAGLVVIVFDEANETTTIVAKEDLKHLKVNDER